MFLEVPSLTYHSPVTIAFLTYGLQRIFDFFNCVTSRVPASSELCAIHFPYDDHGRERHRRLGGTDRGSSVEVTKARLSFRI